MCPTGGSKQVLQVAGYYRDALQQASLSTYEALALVPWLAATFLVRLQTKGWLVGPFLSNVVAFNITFSDVIPCIQ